MPRRGTRFLAPLALVVGGLVVLPAVIDAIYVSPTAVFMDQNTPAAQVTLGNSGDAAEEAEIELQFGFVDADSSGIPFVRFIEDPGSQFPSAASWIRPFPRRVRLEPGERQVVRLLASPPADLPDGEYWSRLIITSRGAALPVASGDTTVRAGVNVELRLVGSVTYRKGDLSTGLSLGELGTEAKGDSLVVWARLARLGNAAYLGTATFEVVNGAGTTVRSWSSVVAVYYAMRRRFAFPGAALAPGEYRLRLSVTSDRADLQPGQALRAARVADSVAFAVP